MLDECQRHARSLTLLHFAGHADSMSLSFETTDGHAHTVNAASFAEFLGGIKGLHLVFLNGCSTKMQVEALLAHGVRAVVATSSSVPDEVATALAERFYKAIAGGAAVRDAFHQATGAIMATFGEGALQPARDVGTGEQPDAPFSWEIFGEPDALVHQLIRARSSVGTRCRVVITATLEQFDALMIARVTAELQRLADDLSLQITSIESGSVRLQVSLSKKGARRLIELWKHGGLNTLCGFEVTVIEVVEDVRSRAVTSPSTVPDPPPVLASGSETMLAAVTEGRASGAASASTAVPFPPEPAWGTSVSVLKSRTPEMSSAQVHAATQPFPLVVFSSTTLGSSSVQVRAATRRLPWVIGGLVVAAAAVAISVVLATSGSDSPTREIGYDELPPAAQVGAGSNAVPPAGAPTRGVTAPPPAADTAAAEPEINMEEVEEKNGGEKNEVASPCQELVKARKWAELEKCADNLKVTDPTTADKLKRSAQEEVKTAPRIAAFDAAIRAKNLKAAKAELSQVWPESIELPKLKNRYFAAENQAITELAAELERVKDSDCKAYEALLAKEKTVKPTRVTTEAVRKTPCTVTKCDADALAQRANDEYGRRRYAAALDLYDRAIRCRPDPGFIRKAFDLACENNMRARAKALWKQMTSSARASAKASCTRNGITEVELNAL